MRLPRKVNAAAAAAEVRAAGRLAGRRRPTDRLAGCLPRKINSDAAAARALENQQIRSRRRTFPCPAETKTRPTGLVTRNYSFGRWVPQLAITAKFAIDSAVRRVIENVARNFESIAHRSCV